MDNALFKWVIGFMAIDDPFNYEILMRCNRLDTDKVPTMGIGVVNHELTLMTNPEFTKTLTKEEVTFVLRHEVMHAVLHHITHRMPSDPKDLHLCNLAMDLAINCLIPDNANCRFPRYKEDVKDEEGNVIYKAGDKMGEYPSKYGFPDKLSFEQYLELLRRKVEEQKDGDGKGGSNNPMNSRGFDSHDHFRESQLVDAAIKEAVDIISKTDRWGKMPAEMVELIRRAQIAEVPWWRYLRHEIGKFISPKKSLTKKRPHKKYGYPYFGTKMDTQDAVLCAWDVSGSVDSKALSKFTAELERLNQFTTVFFIQFDCHIKNERPMKLSRRRLKEMKVLGRGGTAFQPVIDYAIKHKYKKVIIMSDGYAPAPDTYGKKLQILWVITPDGAELGPEFKGKVVKMKKTY